MHKFDTLYQLAAAIDDHFNITECLSLLVDNQYPDCASKYGYRVFDSINECFVTTRRPCSDTWEGWRVRINTVIVYKGIVCTDAHVRITRDGFYGDLVSTRERENMREYYRQVLVDDEKHSKKLEQQKRYRDESQYAVGYYKVNCEDLKSKARDYYDSVKDSDAHKRRRHEYYKSHELHCKLKSWASKYTRKALASGGTYIINRGQFKNLAMSTDAQENMEILREHYNNE